MQNKKSDPPVTRTEFLKETGSIRKELRTQTTQLALDLKEVKETMTTKEDLRQEVGKVLGAIDAFAQKAENYDRKAVFHESRINDHEERIVQLEKTV